MRIRLGDVDDVLDDLVAKGFTLREG